MHIPMPINEPKLRPRSSVSSFLHIQFTFSPKISLLPSLHLYSFIPFATSSQLSLSSFTHKRVFSFLSSITFYTKSLNIFSLFYINSKKKNTLIVVMAELKSKLNKRHAFTSKCASLVKEQRARLYILRRCATMLCCWYIHGDE